jgi:hypothetical protein
MSIPRRPLRSWLSFWILPIALPLGCSGPGPLPIDDDAPATVVDTPTPSVDDASTPSVDDTPATTLDAPALILDAGTPTAPDVPPSIDLPAAVGGCVPTVATGMEATDALCANGVDDDCNGYIDCRDFRCSRNPAVTVCHPDAGPGRLDVPRVVDVPPVVDVTPVVDVPTSEMDASIASVGPTGGTVPRLRFGVFGDVRPPSQNNTTMYPAAVVTAVMDGIAAEGAEFAVANGDYMFATSAGAANAQLGLLLTAESRFHGHVFHSLGNHECNGASNSNCPLGNETPMMQAYRARLAPAYSTPYFDWRIHTAQGDAHFIATAPNAWSPAQQAWLTRVVAEPALYTFVVAHEPAGRREAPGSPSIEAAIAARPGGVTLRLYGHTHEYQHLAPNAIIVGNAGAPLASLSGQYGFVIVDQRADGNLVVTAYTIGHPAMVADSFVLTPGGRPTR